MQDGEEKEGLSRIRKEVKCRIEGKMGRLQCRLKRRKGGIGWREEERVM